MGRSATSKAFAPSAVLSGVLLGLGFAVACALLIGFILTLAPWDSLPSWIGVFHLLSAAVGGAWAAQRCQRFGWIHGGAVGLIYVLVVSAAFVKGFQTAHLASPDWLAQAGWTFLAGAVGGALGVNVRGS